MSDRLMHVLEQIAKSNERLAIANEQLIDLAKSEQAAVAETAEQMFDGPACPHCGAFDPMTRSTGGEGNLMQFVLATHCGECGRIFYAIPVGWRITDNKDEAARLLEGRETQ